jgi:uracil-DNA glycosylase
MRSTRRRRIRGARVPPLFPARGPVDVVLIGEAPGPRGADRSGIPFWGDRSGRILYDALSRAGLADVPDEAWSHWDGAELLRRALRPRLRRAALTNALPFCPTKDGQTFCAPSRADLLDGENRARMLAELRRAARRCRGDLSVIALGRKAKLLVDSIADAAPPVTVHHVPHPSAQALTSGRPGASVAALQAEWQDQLLGLLPGDRPKRR